MALMEAMASRMCVVCTEIRGNTDLVEDGKTGRFVENTPQALAGLPVALMEAMASRMCVVCTEIRGNTDLVEDGKTGRFVENTPQALAQTIAQLYDQPEQRVALGAAAQRRAADFDQQAVLEQVKQLYLH